MGEDASLRVNCEGRAITVSRPSSLSVLMAGALKQAIFLVRRGRAEQAVNLSVQTGGEVKHTRGVAFSPKVRVHKPSLTIGWPLSFLNPAYRQYCVAIPHLAKWYPW